MAIGQAEDAIQGSLLGSNENDQITGNDRMWGSSGDDLILTRDGADQILVRGGSDVVIYGFDDQIRCCRHRAKIN